MTTPTSPATPSRKDRMRPTEYLLIAGGIALFSGLVTFMVTRDLIVGVVALGIIFIIALMTLALLALAIKPDEAERDDIDAQDVAARNKSGEGTAPH